MADGGGNKKERRREAEGGFKPAIQNYGTFVATGLQAQSDTGLDGSSTGKVQLAPGYYSLGVESNVPFIIIKGPSRWQKRLSWGETVAIPEGFAGTIFNDSYHPGDVVLKGGEDWPSVPRRITVPVDFDVTDFSLTQWQLTPKWPVDTRRARQAFLMYEVGAPNTGTTVATTVVVRGARVKGSHYTKPSAGQAAGYEHTLIVPAGPFGYVPLGYNFPDAFLFTAIGFPHCLLDTAIVEPFLLLKADVVGNPASFPMYYVVEY